VIAGSLFYGVALGAGMGALIRLWRLGSATNRQAGLAYCLALAALTATFTAMAPPTQRLVNQVISDGAKFLGNALTLTAAFSGLVVTLYSQWPPELAAPRVRRRLPWLLLTLVVLSATFALPHGAALTGSFDGLYTRHPELVAYTVVYATYLGATLISQARMFWTFARPAPFFFATGLRLFAMADALGVLYAVAKLVVLATHIATRSTTTTGDASGVCHQPFSSTSCAVAVGAPAIVVSVFVAAVFLCLISLRLDKLAQWIGHARSYRRLTPLWIAVTAAHPELLNRASIAGLENTAESIEWRLTQRYVEIRDALLLLSPYRPVEEFTATVTNGNAHSPEAEEAAAILTALRAEQSGNPVPNTAPRPVPGPRGGIDPDRAWLERVAIAFNHIASLGVATDNQGAKQDAA